MPFDSLGETPQPSTPAWALKAADLLRTFGWTTGVLINRTTGEMCIAGAINLALTGDVHYRALPPSRWDLMDPIGDLDCLQPEARALSFANTMEMVLWNNEHAKGIEDVIARLLGAKADQEADQEAEAKVLA